MFWLVSTSRCNPGRHSVMVGTLNRKGEGVALGSNERLISSDSICGICLSRRCSRRSFCAQPAKDPDGRSIRLRLRTRELKKAGKVSGTSARGTRAIRSSVVGPLLSSRAVSYQCCMIESRRLS